MNDYERIEENARKFPFTTRDLVMIAAFFAALMATEAVWALGSVAGNCIYGIFAGAVWISAAVVIGKRYTILTLGVVKTIVELFFGSMYGGTFAAVNYLIGAIVLEGILWLSTPYAANKKLNVIGMVISSIVASAVYVVIIVYGYGMALSEWLMLARVIIPIIPFAAGAVIGNSLGNKIKNIMSGL